MRTSIFRPFCWLLALSTSVSALNLLEVIASYPELSSLYSKINGSAVLAPLIGGADGFTFFAPTNNALDTFLKSHSNATQDTVFQALIQYSLVKGGYSRVTFTEQPQFVKSNLVDAKYSNVTGGQVLELVERGGQAQVVSGNQSVSILSQTDIVSAGGIVHIIDTPLKLPVAAVNAISDARLSFFISILTRGGYLSRATNQYVHDILDSTDVTYFIPNTASALENFTAKATVWQEDDFKRGFQYHVIPKSVGYSDNLKNGTSFTTVEGSNFTITKLGKDIYVNAAKVIATDILVSNGVIHVIDNFLDRTNTAPPSLAIDTNSTIVTSSPTSSEVPVSTTEPTTIPTPSSTATTVVANKSTDKGLTLKVALGAGIGGAAVLMFIAFYIILRRRKNKRRQRAPPLPPHRESSVWEGHSMSTAPSDPKRYFVNKDGVVQQRPTRGESMALSSVSRDSGGPPGYVGPTMVPVTNLERGEAAARYYGGGSRAQEHVEVPMRSPSRIKSAERSYF